MKYLYATTLFLHAGLMAWNLENSPMVQSTLVIAPPTSATFPFNPSQAWFTDQSYLLFKPVMGDLDYATRIASKEIDASTVNHKVKVKKPEYQWDSGVRFGFGRFLPNHEQWDISLYTTYFYGDADDHTHVNFDHDEGIYNAFVPNFRQLVSKASVHWQLNYFTFDLMLGRTSWMTRDIVFHPYLGLRSTLQYQHYHSRYFHRSVDPDFGEFKRQARNTMNNDYWGIGPRVGTNFIYYFQPHWTFLGNLAAAFMLGKQSMDEKQQVVLSSPTGVDKFPAKSRDGLRAIRVNVEGNLGLGWETWVRDDTVRIAPSLLFEGSVWFAMNQLWRINNGIHQTNNRVVRQHGNLGLMGLVFDLTVDF